MKDTVCQKCIKKSCANKIELQWFDEKGQAHTIFDCAPKRTLLMQREVHQRLIGFQGAMETMRNEIHSLKTTSDQLKSSLFAFSMTPQNAPIETYAAKSLPNRQLQDGT